MERFATYLPHSAVRDRLQPLHLRHKPCKAQCRQWALFSHPAMSAVQSSDCVKLKNVGFPALEGSKQVFGISIHLLQTSYSLGNFHRDFGVLTRIGSHHVVLGATHTSLHEISCWCRHKPS